MLQVTDLVLCLLSLGESVQSSLGQSERARCRLILITAIHHGRLSLPTHVCFDLFLSSAVTVKDEGPCGRSGTVPWITGAQEGLMGPGPRALGTGHSAGSELCVSGNSRRRGYSAGRLIADPKV